MKEPECVLCGGKHYQTFCAHKPRKAIKTSKPLVVAPQHLKLRPCKWCGITNDHLEFLCIKRPKKVIHEGKQSKKWKLTRQRWIDANPYPFYTCHYCGKGIATSEMTLDHKIPRSRAPELRHDFGNLVPACFSCNGLKGSVDHDSYPHECHS